MPLTLAEKELQIAQLIEKTTENTDLPFYAPNNLFVPGKGPLDADIMLIGEAPGKEEALQGKPFVGRSGQLLSKLLAEAGFDRSKLFITNIAKYRPPENKTPTYKESTAWAQAYLKPEILIVAPKIIVTLGACATKVFLGKKISMNAHQGTVVRLKTITLFPTYHPAYLLRNPHAIPTVQKTLQNVHSFLPEIVDNFVHNLLITQNTKTGVSENDR